MKICAIMIIAPSTKRCIELTHASPRRNVPFADPILNPRGKLFSV
jgi:hypothetical protein